MVIHPSAMGVPMNMDCVLQLLTMGSYVWDVLWEYTKGIQLEVISKYLQSVYSISNGAAIGQHSLVNPVGDCFSPFMAMPKPYRSFFFPHLRLMGLHSSMGLRMTIRKDVFRGMAPN